MTLREYLKDCKNGRGKILIALYDDGNFGIDNLNEGKYWKSENGNWDLDSAEEFDAFRDCSEELVRELLDSYVVEVDAFVDNKEQKDIYLGDEYTSPNRIYGYLAIIVHGFGDLYSLAEEYFNSHGTEKKHYFMKEDNSWPCSHLTKEEYNEIYKIWHKYYEIRGYRNKISTYNISGFCRTVIMGTFLNGLETYQKVDVSLENAEKLLKEIEKENREAQKQAEAHNSHNYSIKTDKPVSDEIIQYATKESLKVIGFNAYKFEELCRLTNFGNTWKNYRDADDDE